MHERLVNKKMEAAAVTGNFLLYIRQTGVK